MQLKWIGEPMIIKERETVRTISKEQDTQAFCVGLGVIVAVIVFTIWVLLK